SRGRETRTPQSKTRLGRRVCIFGAFHSGRSNSQSDPPRMRRLLQDLFLATGGVCPRQGRFRAGAAAPVGGPMLAFVPTVFDLSRRLRPRRRWAMQCLVSYADHAGRCFPSLRNFAVQAGISKRAAGRALPELAEAGLVTRKRRPGGVYVYQIARRFLPQWAAEQVSQH